MLTPEQAKAAVAARLVRDDTQRRLNEISGLPDALRSIAYALIDRDENGNAIKITSTGEGRQQLQYRQDRAFKQLDTITPEERIQIFVIFFPHYADAVELAWQFMRTHSYTQRGIASMFRAPGHPERTRSARSGWLQNMLRGVAQYQADVVWLAQHASYLGYYGPYVLGPLFAAVIESGTPAGDEVFDILVATAEGRHEIATMGQHVSNALLAASRPEGWECIERLLLAAQREEGLRQTILMSVKDAHPQAFRRLLDVIVRHNLARYSAITLAANTWLGASWDSGPSPTRTRVLARLVELLGSVDARREALAGSAEDVYLALWSMATEDVYAAIARATPLARDADPQKRIAAIRLLAAAEVTGARESLLRALADPDAQVVYQAWSGLIQNAALLNPASPAFEQIEVALARLPKHPAPPQSVLWGVQPAPFEREQAADLLVTCLGDRSPMRLVPHLSEFSEYRRAHVAALLAGVNPPTAESRAALLSFLGDRASWVRQQTLELLKKTSILPDETPTLEALLTRKDVGLRRGILSLLITLPDEHVLASADRLLASRYAAQRTAGLETLRVLHEAGRASALCAARAKAYRDTYAQQGLSEAERVLLEPVLDGQRDVPVLDDALGLADPSQCTVPPEPVAHARQWVSRAAIAGLLALDALVHEHRSDTYVIETQMGQREGVIGDDNWGFPRPHASTPVDQDVARLPLADIWRGWAQSRPEALRDADGFEFLRMLPLIERRKEPEVLAYLKELGLADEPRLPLRYPHIVNALCWWLARLNPAAGTADFLLDRLETMLATLPEEQLREIQDTERPYGIRYQRLDMAVGMVRTYSNWKGGGWTRAHTVRLWNLLRWTTRLTKPTLRYVPHLQESLEAHAAGAASDADLLMQFLGPRASSSHGYYGGAFTELHELSSRTPHPFLARYPAAVALYTRCVERAMEVELARGEMPTAATPAVMSLRSLTGAPWFVRLLRALGNEPFARGYVYHETGKTHSLSRLLRVTFPTPDDTLEAFAEQVAAARIPQQRLVEAAVYAPQWARHIEHILGWEHFAEAVWWVYAHTKGRDWSLDPAIRDEWSAQISEWTALASDDLYDGAVDVAWFQRIYAHLGEERWDAIYRAAKYSSTGIGHARARLFADAMTGNVEERILTERVTAKRNRDAACALGLLNLPDAPARREKTLLARYQVLQEFIRTSRSFGPQRREGDQKAARIGMENLARTAGYPDVQRFQWAMELREASDLNPDALTVTRDEVTVALRIDSLGQSHLDVTRGNRSLKQIPPRLKKDPDVIRLRERAKALDQQRTRMRLALEQAMCREDTFPAHELRQLLGHPVLAPQLEQLVFAGPDGMGYLVNGGRALRSWTGEDVPLAPDSHLRIAHPYDLLRSGDWSRWQHECFAGERIQPFKQVFRELYVLTDAERQADTGSPRYAGQQVQPQQAMALLGQRGWVTNAQDATASRTFHERRITASLTFLLGGGTAVDVDGLTIENVIFSRSGDPWSKRPALEEVPPVVFSEVMRDVDLVVSVAHRGGVDPESSASTVEMRSALIREVCGALGIANVRLRASRALIEGKLGEYSIHLGSGTVHRLPGGALCIIPVHAQHRGRLFLPFADDDPKTAEIVSKVLLLARDTEIRDPLILQQIYAKV